LIYQYKLLHKGMSDRWWSCLCLLDEVETIEPVEPSRELPYHVCPDSTIISFIRQHNMRKTDTKDP